MVDGYGIGDVGSVVLKDRKTLSQSGLITISVALDQATGSLMSEPKLNTRGFVFVEEHMDLINEAISVVYNTIGKSTSNGALDEASLSRAIRSDMKTFIYNFNGDIYETTTAFDATYRAKMAEAKANGETVTRQVIDGNKVVNEYYHPAGIWMAE
jgi:hypothetical protein